MFCDTIRQEINNGKLVGYIDISKAFNTIGHSMLFKKLQMYGVEGEELAWFVDYLFGRHLNVMYEGNKINFVAQYKYLGTVIDNHLNLNENFDRAYRRASTRLSLLECLKPYLTDATIKVYLAMLIPLMASNSTICIPYTNTQCKKLPSIDRRANSVIKSNVAPIGSLLNRDICMLKMST